MRSRFHHGSYHRRPLEASRRFIDASPTEHGRCIVSDEQETQPLTGRARSLANLKRYPKGQTGNRSGGPKDLRKFGDILMKEFYKSVAASLGGKTVNKMQGEILAMQMMKAAISAVQGGRRSLDGLRASPCTRGGAPSCRS